MNCLQAPPRLGDNVTYNSNPGNITNILYEITYKDGRIETVPCNESNASTFINVQYSIDQEAMHSASFDLSHDINSRGGTRRRRRKNRKTRYGMETRS
jgi:hypothetical protein